MEGEQPYLGDLRSPWFYPLPNWDDPPSTADLFLQHWRIFEYRIPPRSESFKTTHLWSFYLQKLLGLHEVWRCGLRSDGWVYHLEDHCGWKGEAKNLFACYGCTMNDTLMTSYVYFGCVIFSTSNDDWRLKRCICSCIIVSYGGFLKCGTQQPWVFPLKMIILGCFGGTTI